MPLYPLHCEDCGADEERYAPITAGKGSTSCECGGVLARVYTVPATPTPFRPHFNHSIGAYVSSMREFRDGLRKGESEQNARGHDVSYEVVNAGDSEALGATEAGLEPRRRLRRELGLDEPKKTYFPG